VQRPDILQKISWLSCAIQLVAILGPERDKETDEAALAWFCS
jgi:hypothetical protein